MNMLKKLQQSTMEFSQNFIDGTLSLAQSAKGFVNKNKEKVLASTAAALMVCSMGAQANNQEVNIVTVENNKGQQVELVESSSLNNKGDYEKTYGSLSNKTFLTNEGYTTFYQDYPEDFAVELVTYLNDVADKRGHDVAQHSEIAIRLALSQKYGENCSVEAAVPEAYGKIMAQYVNMDNADGYSQRVKLGSSSHADVLDTYNNAGEGDDICGDNLVKEFNGEKIDISFNGTSFEFSSEKDRARSLENNKSQIRENVEPQERPDSSGSLRKVRDGSTEDLVEVRDGSTKDLVEVRDGSTKDLEQVRKHVGKFLNKKGGPKLN